MEKVMSSMKSKIFSVRSLSTQIDFSLLLVRIVMGLAFVLHGWGKIQSPFQWMGPEAPIPSFLQALAALSEFGGGLLLAFGLFTRIAALAIGATMFVAVSFHLFILGDPFVSMIGKGSYELALVYFTIALLLLFVGPGRFSLDRKIFGLKA